MPAPKAMTLAAAAPATPRRGRGPQPSTSAGESSRYSTLAPAMAPAGRSMRPVPRITLASELKSQKTAAPPKSTRE